MGYGLKPLTPYLSPRLEKALGHNNYVMGLQDDPAKLRASQCYGVDLDPDNGFLAVLVADNFNAVAGRKIGEPAGNAAVWHHGTDQWNTPASLSAGAENQPSMSA